jgi:GrpB-like predicted nucleotidyltransferase (UPF0157 family)
VTGVQTCALPISLRIRDAVDANKDEALREEEIRASTVGELRMHGGPITLVPYDDRWPKLFARQAEHIRGVLGERALMIEHVGSTAVPGLSAKPIIDLLLVVDDSAREEAYMSDMEAAGYVLQIREPHWTNTGCSRAPTPTSMSTSSRGDAPRSTGCFRSETPLRSNQEDRLLYERTKQELARREWKYVQNYTDAKGEVVEDILARARHRSGDSGKGT